MRNEADDMIPSTLFTFMYAHRSSRADVGPCPLPLFPQRKKESNDRISTRLSRAYWPPLLSCYHYYTTTLDSTLQSHSFTYEKQGKNCMSSYFICSLTSLFPKKIKKCQKLNLNLSNQGLTVRYVKKEKV